MTIRHTVVSLYDYTGEAVRAWAEAGYECFCYDIQHEGERTETIGKGSITFAHADLLADSPDWERLYERHKASPPAMVFAWPMCTDLAVSGARHWAVKAEKDPDFQIKAAANAKAAAAFAERLDAPYMVENPIGALVNLWRQWNYKFSPYEFGGYLAPDDPHPKWPDLIPLQDAYTKLTCLWTGGGFIFPEKSPVEPEQPVELVGKNGKVYRGSAMWAKLGGKSLRTKNIRSATPRGFARAVFLANAQKLPLDALSREAA